jgi:hypothetical protein
VTCDSGQGPDTVPGGFTTTGGRATPGGGRVIEQSDPAVTNRKSGADSGMAAPTDPWSQARSYGSGADGTGGSPGPANCALCADATFTESTGGTSPSRWAYPNLSSPHISSLDSGMPRDDTTPE